MEEIENKTEIMKALYKIPVEHHQTITAIIEAEPEKYKTPASVELLCQQLVEQMQDAGGKNGVVNGGAKKGKGKATARGPLQPFWNSHEPTKVLQEGIFGAEGLPRDGSQQSDASSGPFQKMDG